MQVDVANRNLRSAVAVLFLLAQFLYAVHVGASPTDFPDHAAPTCEICLAAATSNDPASNEVALLRVVALDLPLLDASRAPLTALPAWRFAEARAPPIV